MDKSVTPRLIPRGGYIDALNVRIGSQDAESEIGEVTKAKGNELLVTLKYNDVSLSSSARTIGAYEDGVNETIYWFVHDPANTESNTGKCDLIVSYNTRTMTARYHVISVDDGGGENTTLNFNPTYLITGVELVDGELLFFTDDLNEPRVINVVDTDGTRYPPPSGGVDQIVPQDINVIVAPPPANPNVELIDRGGNENYMEEIFHAFAYRWKYRDGQYSATSQFTLPQFQPGAFDLDIDTYLNEGMVNIYNGVKLSFEVGGDNVIGVDLLFKRCDDTTIRVIERYDKEDEGWTDESEQTVEFDNSKIFTLLPSSEILRLYDNVPRKAKALTLMGNRMVYGNYVDGYNLIDSNGDDVILNYETEPIAEDIGFNELTTTTSTGTYDIDSISAPGHTVSSGVAEVTFPSLSSVPLTAGSLFTATFSLSSAGFTGADTPYPTAQTAFVLELYVTLQANYASVNDFFLSDEFIDAIGTTTSIQPISTACTDGTSLTDAFVCAIQDPSGYDKKSFGVSCDATDCATNQPVLTTYAGSNTITFQFPAMRYNVNGSPSTDQIFEYFSVTGVSASLRKVGDARSLHSDWDYETAIIYMDEYSRSTTALVSRLNTVHIPAANSGKKNSVKVTVPSNMRPPSWATRFKFAMRPSRENYEVVYANVYYEDPIDRSIWVKLDGENQKKVEVGDTLRVKRDTSGILTENVKAVVLDKVAQERDFIEDDGDVDENGNPILQLPGTYMRLRPSDYDIDTSAGQFLTNGKLKQDDNDTSDGAYLEYPVYVTNDDESYTVWAINKGDIVSIELIFKRNQGATLAGVTCPEEICEYKKDFIATTDYSNFRAFFLGDGLNNAITNTTCSSGSVDTVFETNFYNKSNPSGNWINTNFMDGTHQVQFVEDSNTNQLWLAAKSGSTGCPGTGVFQNIPSKVRVRISITSGNNILIFETQPSESTPGLFYEGADTYSIDAGAHISRKPLTGTKINENDVSQTIGSVDGEFYLSFHNCYAFGNGAESYKIRDSITGASFNLGERVTAVSDQDYKEADRFADLTYSGVYNNESNINKLNEFNLGLANFKQIEERYGPIQHLYGRATDIEVLSEDRVGYVQAGKNLLTDAVGGGTVTSVPEVLGTYIARIEEYGISENPESWAVYGYDRFFTDAKRGVVLKLSGSSYTNDQLSVISEMGMREYFRDLFIGNFNTQKLGGYDPFNNEYVLASNEILLPEETINLPCNTTVQQSISEEDYAVTVAIGEATGDVIIDYLVLSGTINILVVYGNDPVTYESGLTGSGSITITNDDPSVEEIGIYVCADERLTNVPLLGNPVTTWSLQSPLTQTGTSPFSVGNIQVTGRYVSQDLYLEAGTYRARYKFRNTNTAVHDYSWAIIYGGIVVDVMTDNGAEAGRVFEGYADFTVDTAGTQTFGWGASGPSSAWEVFYLSVCKSAEATFELTINCPTGTEMSVIPVVLTSPTDEGKTHHIEFDWTDGSFTSPTTNRFVSFGAAPSPIVSDYATYTGLQGDSVIPTNGSTVRLYAKRQGNDSYTFTSDDRMRYLRSATLYENNASDIETLIGLSTEIVPSGADPTFSGTFALDNTANEYLYLIWDMRDRVAKVLCYSETESDACCECTSCAGCTPFNSTAVQASAGNACLASLTEVYYHDGDDVLPVVGDTIYGAATCDGTFVGVSDGYYGFGDGTYMEVASGVVTDVSGCP